MPYDILYRLQVPLPYNLAGMTIKELRDERREAADEIERLRAELQLAHSQIAIIATAEVEEEPF